MNSRQIGRRTELKAKAWLEENGWKVCLTSMPQKFKKSQDFFGMWDILAVKKSKGQTWFKFVQVKTNQWGDIRKCKEFYEEYFYNSEDIFCEIWMWKDRKWHIRRL